MLRSGKRDRIGRAVAQPDRLAAGERMAGRHDGDQTLFEPHQRLEARQERRPEHQDEIDLVGGERRHRLLVVEHLDVECDERMQLAELADLARQEIERERLAAGDAHGAAAQSAQVFDLRLHAVDVVALLAQVMHEHFARGGEPHAARPALEQPRAEFVLQIHDAAVERRGRDVEVIRRLADRARARDLVDVSQNPQVLHRPPELTERVLFERTLAKNQRQISALN